MEFANVSGGVHLGGVHMEVVVEWHAMCCVCVQRAACSDQVEARQTLQLAISYRDHASARRTLQLVQT